MRQGSRFVYLALGCVCGLGLLLPTSAVWGQANNNNQNNNIGAGPAAAGVMVSPDGVLRVKQYALPNSALAAKRIADAKVKLGGKLTTPSKLRKISLNRLEAAVAEQIAKGEGVSDEMKYLAGLTRLENVFYYPETHDIVVAGPAEGFVEDVTKRVIGMNSGEATLELQDLIAALRAFPPGGDATQVIGCSIDPTKEGLMNMQKFLSSIRPGPSDGPRVAQGLRESLGKQVVTVRGVNPKTHYAQVMVEADYRMKLIGIGLEQPPAKIVSYVERARPNDVSRNAMQRWFFTPNYTCVRVTEDELAMELVGDGVQLVGENELVNADGGRVASKSVNLASTAFCDSFTKNYPQLAKRSPVYAQLRNLVDMAIAAAFIQEQDYYGKAGWKMDLFRDEEKLPIETYETPKQVETAANAIIKGNTLMTPVGGGVNIQARQALQSENLLKDEKGALKQLQQSVKLSDLPADQWWWD
jgi:hypothetical protein